MDEDEYNFGSNPGTTETVEGFQLDPFVVTENRDTGDTGDDYTPTEPGMWDDFWGPDSWNEEEPGNFWDSLTAAFDAGAGRALANVKKAVTPSQAAAAAAGRPIAASSGGGSSSSSRPNQSTTTNNNTTNNVLTSPVAVLAMIFGGIYLLKISNK